MWLSFLFIVFIHCMQSFFLEPTDDGKWIVRSLFLNKHLSAHELGEVSIKTDGRTPSELWTIEFLDGLVAFKSSHGKYLSGDENNLQCKVYFFNILLTYFYSLSTIVDNPQP